MKPQLLVATRNAGKLREFRQALEKEGIDVVGLDALGDATEVEETGATFEANAKLKAEGYSRRTDLVVLADDSGIEVDALDGDPGVRSARWGGPELDDAGRNARLLAELEHLPEQQRSARFRCVLAVARHGTTLATFEGVIEGRIAEAPKGENGFGYDPIFFYPPKHCTTAELPIEEKRKVSHRGRATAQLVDALHSGDLPLEPHTGKPR